MRLLSREKLKKNRSRATSGEVEARFLRLYSRWHETHDLSLRKKLFLRLKLLMREIPDFDIRRKFENAF
jgi:hypothetical protein